MIEDHVFVPLAVDGQDERVERHVLDDLERADAEVLAPPVLRVAEVVDPVADVVNYRHAATHRNVFLRATTLVRGSLEGREAAPQDVADLLLARRFAGPGAAGGAKEGANGVVHRGVAPATDNLAVIFYVQPGVCQGGLEVAGGRESVRGVVGRLFGRDERVHGLVHDRALGTFGCREQAGHDAAVRTGDAGRLAQRPQGVTSELERVDAEHRVERGVVERQALHVAFAQVGAWQPVAGDTEQARADIQAAGHRAALGGQDQRESRAAADIQHAGAVAHACGVEDRLEERLVVGLGQVRPRARVGAPQAALDLRGGAEPGRRGRGGAGRGGAGRGGAGRGGAGRGGAGRGGRVAGAGDLGGGHAAAGAGWMFWLSRKTLSGS